MFSAPQNIISPKILEKRYFTHIKNRKNDILRTFKRKHKVVETSIYRVSSKGTDYKSAPAKKGDAINRRLYGGYFADFSVICIVLQ